MAARRGDGRGGIGWTTGPTAREVADLAGVSTQTVSRVANGASNVRGATRDRVLDAMAQLGYTPNQAARMLRSGRSDVIGVVLHHLTRTGEAHIVEAVIATAHRHGFTVTLADAGAGAARDLDRAMSDLAPLVSGLVVVGIETADLDRIHAPGRVPIVVVDSRHSLHPSVGFDQRGGAHLAVTHLLGLGHRTVHHVAGPDSSLQAAERAEAWRRTLQAAGRPVPDVLHGDWTPASGYAAGQRLARDPQVTAVFCANDEMALGVLHALHEAGRAVPGEVSVVGFDDVAADHVWPPLTTVHQDFAAIGEGLVEVLVRRLHPDHGSAGPIPTLVEAHLVVRGSTAPPAPGRATPAQT